MCRCVPGGQKRKFDLLGVEVTGICGMPSLLLCGCWNWNCGPLDYAARVFFPLLRAISPAPRIVLVLDSLCCLILGIK